MSSLADRIKQRLDDVGLTAAELARACKVKPPSVWAWLSGDTKTIKGENLLRAAQALQCSPHWLATGLGPKLINEGAGPPAQAARDERNVSYFTDKLVEEGAEILRLLDRESRREALLWLRGFAAGRKIEPWASAHRERHPPAKARGR